MIISHRFKTVFLHIPKNAGTAIRNVLTEGDPECERTWGYRFLPRHYRFWDSAHIPLVDLHPEKLEFINNYDCCAVLRDPLERFVSATLQHFGQHNYRTPRTPAQLLNELDSTRIRYDPAYIHFCPQHFFTHIGPRHVVKHLFRMSDPNMETQIMAFLSVQGFPVQGSKIPRRNLAQSEKPMLGDDFDMERFYQLYKRDYDLFGFTPPMEKKTFEADTSAYSEMDQPFDFSSYDKIRFLDWDFERPK